MWITRPAAVGLLVLMTGLPALAQPIEIATLGRAPLMGSSTNMAELKRNFERNQSILELASRKIGMTADQYATFKTQVEIGNARWVTIPRNLEKMTWAADGRVHVLSDVRIPAGQKGLEVAVPDGPTSTMYVYLPAKCGNLSYVRRARIAQQPSFPQPHPLVAAAQNFPAPQTPLVAATGVSGTTPAVSPVAIVPAVAHHFSLLPLAALLPFIINGGGGGGCVPGPAGSNSCSPTPGTISGPPPCP
jgi:hypothetical protein